MFLRSSTGTPVSDAVKFNMADPLSYTILLEEALAEKKCRQKHGGFWPEMTPLPWLLVPPAHANTTDQAQFEPATVQTPPPGFSENIY